MDLATFRRRMRGSERTKKLYVENVGRYLRWLDGHKETPASAQEYIDSLTTRELSPNTIAVAGNALRAYWEAQNKTLRLYLPKIQMGKPRYYRQDEIKRLFAACEKPIELELLTLLFDTGARISEVLGIRVDGIDLEQKTVRVVRKGGREDGVALTARGVEAIKSIMARRRGRHQELFGDLNYNDAYYLLKRVAERAGLEGFTIHRLRHSVAYDMGIRLREQGFGEMDILHAQQQVLGHRSIRTTADLYAALQPQDRNGLRGEW
jgi:integrase